MSRSFFEYDLFLDVNRDSELCNPAMRLLGHVALDLTQSKIALEIYNETLATRLKIVSTNDSTIVNVYDSIVCALIEMSDEVQALTILKKVVAIHKADDSTRMTRTNAILAMTHLRARNAKQALETIQDCWRLQDLTENQLQMSRYLKHNDDIVLLSRIRYMQGDRDSVFELASKSIIMRKDMFDAKESKVADSMYHVAKMLTDEDKIVSAMKLLKDIIEMSSELIEMRRHHARTLWTLTRLKIEVTSANEIQKLQQEVREMCNNIEDREIDDVNIDEDFAKFVDWMLW